MVCEWKATRRGCGDGKNVYALRGVARDCFFLEPPVLTVLFYSGLENGGEC